MNVAADIGFQIRDELRATFRKGVTRPFAWRRHQLLQLARMAQENAEAFADALYADLGRPRMESYFAEVRLTSVVNSACRDNPRYRLARSSNDASSALRTSRNGESRM